MSTRIVVWPLTFPVSLWEVKQHVRAVDFDDDDELLTLYLKAATINAENFTGRAFIDQTIDYYQDGFPANSAYIELPKPPLIELEGVFYGDAGSAETELAASAYVVDAAGAKARIALANGAVWPTITSSFNSVRIRYRAGYIVDVEASPVVANVPQDVKAAILLQVGSLYANRESISIGEAANITPLAWEHLLRPYRVHTAIG